MPDPAFIEEYADDIIGIVLTHAHEDHIGAVAWLWPKLKAPCYATPLHRLSPAREAARRRHPRRRAADGNPAGRQADARPVRDGADHPHSLDSRAERRLHQDAAGNHPAHRRLEDRRPILSWAPQRISTRSASSATRACWRWCATPPTSFVDGRAGSEADVRIALNALIGGLKGKVAVACFASNVARMDTAIRAAEACGRRVCLVGPLHAPDGGGGPSPSACSRGSSRSCRTPRRGSSPTTRSCICAPAARGRPARALSRIGEGTHPHVKLGLGDHCIFSSRRDPRQRHPDPQHAEQALRPGRAALHRARSPRHPRLRPPLPRRAEGTCTSGRARTSPCRPTGSGATFKSTWPSPATFRCPSRWRPETATWCCSPPGKPGIIDEVKSGRLFLDGGVLTPENSEPLRERRHAAGNGVVIVAVALDGKGTARRRHRSARHRPAGRRGTIRWMRRWTNLAKDAEHAVKKLDAGARQRRSHRRGRPSAAS